MDYRGKLAKGDTTRTSISKAQPMATSTPTSMQNAEQASPLPAIRDYAELSPAPALAVVPPTPIVTGVANTSLALRVPRTFREIKGRCSIHSSDRKARNQLMQPSVKVASFSLGRFKKPGTMKLMTDSPKAEAKTPKPDDGDTSRTRKRQHSQEGSKTSTSAKAARDNDEPSSSSPYHIYQVAINNKIGIGVFKVDPFGATAANQDQGNPPVIAKPTPARIEESNDEDTHPEENPYNNTTEPLPDKALSKKKCLIM